MTGFQISPGSRRGFDILGPDGHYVATEETLLDAQAFVRGYQKGRQKLQWDLMDLLGVQDHIREQVALLEDQISSQ